MANMSYCRFENTYSDLADCVWALEERDELSERERIYADLMYDMCVDYIRAHDKMFD